MKRCELCYKKLNDKEADMYVVCLSRWEIFFCKKHHKEISMVINQLGKEFKEFHNRKNAKYWHLYYRILEWGVIEYIFEHKK